MTPVAMSDTPAVATASVVAAQVAFAADGAFAGVGVPASKCTPG